MRYDIMVKQCKDEPSNIIPPTDGMRTRKHRNYTDIIFPSVFRICEMADPMEKLGWISEIGRVDAEIR